MYSIVFTAGDESQVLAEFATKEEARAYGDRVYRDYVDRGMLTMQQTLRKDANGGALPPLRWLGPRREKINKSGLNYLATCTPFRII